MKDRYVIVAMIVVVGIVVLSALFLRAPFSFGGLNLNPARPNVFSAENAAQIISQDASQRAIFIVPKVGNAPTFSACAEPPPDVSQNIVQNLGSSLDVLGRGEGKVEANIAAKISSDLKTAAELLFQRSQGIQLLRDTMFRLCEGFQNGVLSSEDYRELIQGLITTANFIIPFEQCTSIVRGAPPMAPETMQSIMVECLRTAVSFNQLRLSATRGSTVPFGLPKTSADGDSPRINQEQPSGPPADSAPDTTGKSGATPTSEGLKPSTPN